VPELESPDAKLQSFQDRSWRIVLLRLALVLTIGGSLLFILININRQLLLLAAVQGVVVVLCVGLLVLTARSRRYSERRVLLFLLALFVMLVISFLSLHTTQSSLVWITVIPILAYQLLGRAKGIRLTLSFLIVGFIGFLVKALWLGGPVPWMPLMNFGLATSFIAVFVHVYETRLEAAHRLLVDLASTDALTGLLNRSRFLEAFEYEASRARREGTALAFAVIDLDYFKRINDRYGHAVGDMMLRHVAERIRGRLRATDSPCRLGGEEFGILLPGTSGKQAVGVLESIRNVLEGKPMEFQGQEIPMTLTAGIAELGADGADLTALYRAADARLYRGKAEGRNRVIYD